MAALYQFGERDERNGELQDLAGVCAATLCVDGNTVDVIRQAVVGGKGIFAGGLDEYLRYDSDPLVMQNLQRADMPLWIIGFDRDRAAAIAACHAIQETTDGHCSLVAVADNADADLILEAMRAGCCECLSRPVGVNEFGEAIGRLRTRLNGRKTIVPKPSGRILAMLGARGGAGATTLAVHLEWFLARQYGKRTLLLDEHRRLGHVSLYLGADEANYHFYEPVRNIGRLDESLLHGFVLHHSSCLDILPSPDGADEVANVSLDDIQRVIRILAQNYEFVVIDCPHGVHNLSLAIIDCCAELYLIATPDVPGLRDLSRCIDSFLQSNVSSEKIKVVINRYSSDGALRLRQIEKAIQQPIAITIPTASSDLIRAMNIGSPVLPDRKSEFATQMKKWAATLVPGAEQDLPAPKRRLAFWN